MSVVKVIEFVGSSNEGDAHYSRFGRLTLLGEIDPESVSFRGEEGILELVQVERPVSEAAKKSWQTRRRKKTGNRVAEHRRQLMVKVKGMLKEWGRNVEDMQICAVCGDGLPNSILQMHHLNPFDKSEGEIRLCASCHNIFNKAKETTKLTEIVQDLKLRHKRFERVKKMSLEYLCQRGLNR